MNQLATRLIAVAGEYLGPAAQTWLSRELKALGIALDGVGTQHLATLAQRAHAAARVMGAERAAHMAAAIEALAAADVSAAAPASHGAPASPGARSMDHSGGQRLALDAAESLLRSGKLRQAESAYRELVQKHPSMDAYRGLARAAQAFEDTETALGALRDGAGVLSRAGDRQSAILLLTDAVTLAPRDLATHRRLAAALANAGDNDGACSEYARFIDVALGDGDVRRAWLELTYGRETLGDLPGLVSIVDRVAAAGSMPATAAAPVAAPRVAAAVPTAPKMTPPPVAAASVAATAPAPAATLTAAPAPAKAAPAAAKASAPAAPAEPSEPEANELLRRAGIVRKTEPVRALEAAVVRTDRVPLDLDRELSLLVVRGTGAEAASVASARATVLIGARDGRATEATLDASKRLLSLGLLQAASDLLLDYIGAGYPDREAQRLLIDVDCGIGRRDVAREKCHLLSRAYQLDGRADTAADVERLAGII